MEDPTISNWIFDLMLILAAGLLSGLLCKRLGVSLISWLPDRGGRHRRGRIAVRDARAPRNRVGRATGALLLLFSIGMEFSLGELRRLSRYFCVGGSVQMLLAAVPVVVMLPLLGWNWMAALMIGAATSLSSTVLVFKTLSEYGQLDTRHGRRAIAILLFQDVALVPLMLLMPILTGEGAAGVSAFALLAVSSVLFLLAVFAVRQITTMLVAPMLIRSRSVELVVLFSLTALGLGIGGAQVAGLPPALESAGRRIGAGRQPPQRSSRCHDPAFPRVLRGRVFRGPGDAAAARGFLRTTVAAAGRAGRSAGG